MANCEQLLNYIKNNTNSTKSNTSTILTEIRSNKEINKKILEELKKLNKIIGG